MITEIIYNNSVTHLSNFQEFIEWCQNQINKIPEEYQENATIDFNIGEMPYEDWPYVFLTIEYERHETELEKKIIKRQEKRREEDLRIVEMKELERLKEKYE